MATDVASIRRPRGCPPLNNRGAQGANARGIDLVAGHAGLLDPLLDRPSQVDLLERLDQPRDSRPQRVGRALQHVAVPERRARTAQRQDELVPHSQPAHGRTQRARFRRHAVHRLDLVARAQVEAIEPPQARDPDHHVGGASLLECDLAQQSLGGDSRDHGLVNHPARVVNALDRRIGGVSLDGLRALETRRGPTRIGCRGRRRLAAAGNQEDAELPAVPDQHRVRSLTPARVERSSGPHAERDRDERTDDVLRPRRAVLEP